MAAIESNYPVAVVRDAFFRLGHYPLWGDEADTALFARGVARTGDTMALIDHNIYAFRNGACLKNLHGRYQPPVPYYLAAPFVGVDGTGAFWPRFPFAVLGLLSVGLLLYWMIRMGISASAWIVLSIGLLGNVSFFLFCRQCRYYSLAILLTLIIVYLYMNWKGRRWELAVIVAASTMLLGTNYLSYAALYAALGCDYLVFARRERRLTPRQWLLLFLPQIIIGIFIMWIYNPLDTEIVPDAPEQNLLLDKLMLIWWNFRDLNNCEFCIGIIVLAAPLAYLWTRNVWLLRGAIAAVCYIIIIAIFSPQRAAMTHAADVRYLTPLIPLCIGLSVLIILPLALNRWLLALILAGLVFGSNVLNYPFSPNEWRSRPVQFIRELCNPRETSIDAAVQWISQHILNQESIYVLPGQMRYPLMYHAPQPVYAWQLKYPPEEQFAFMSPIHFLGQIPSDYFIIFGPVKVEVEELIKYLKSRGADYRLEHVLDIYWDDMTRPEIYWHSFPPIEDFDRQLKAVYVYRRFKPQQLK